MRPLRLGSLFSQKLDQAVFVTYFLGAVVPLVTLAFASDGYVFPALERDPTAISCWIGVLVGISVLSLASFLALRRLVHAALARTDADNRRLARLVEVSRCLPSALDGNEVAESALGCALALADADAAQLLLRSEKDKPLSLHATAGEPGSLSPHLDEEIQRLAESAAEAGRPVSLEFAGGEAQRASAAALAIPFGDDDGPSGVLVVTRDGRKAGFAPEQSDALCTLVALTCVSLENTSLQDVQRNFFTHATDMLVSVLDAHVECRDGHASRVAELCNRIGRELGLSEQRLRDLHFAALLHDIGMLKVERQHQRNPAYYRKHPQVGHRLLSRIRIWEGAAPIVLHHHEWYDGGGYPDGLRGEAIPFEARILAVADAFDAMGRQHDDRRGLMPAEALAELRSGSGTQFDPQVVAAFVDLAERGELPDATA